MRFHADLHVHSKYSRATSRDCDLEHLAWWAARKGITVVATGDFTHPAWNAELKDQLVAAEPGLFRLRDDLDARLGPTLPAACSTKVRFMLSVEISTIYKKGDATRKIHHLIYAPDFAAADHITARLARIGNIASDGRPILGLDSRHLLEIVLEAPGAYLVPAHIWTPWFAVLGSKSGFDSITECYADLADHVFAIETGLSSDPPMNWRLSILDRYRLVSNSDAHSPAKLGRETTVFDTALDYFAIRRALETGLGYVGTSEFFPEEGKYHLDGHRKCNVRLDPKETLAHGGRCPVCGRAVTVGVLHRIEALADRGEAAVPPPTAGLVSNLVPLPEILAELSATGPASKTVERQYDRLVASLGPELAILGAVPIADIARAESSLLAEAITRLRAGSVIRDAGYDGEYGVIRLFDDAELRRRGGVLFDAPAIALPTTAPELDHAPVGATHASPSSGAIAPGRATHQGGSGDPPQSPLRDPDDDRADVAPVGDTSLLAGLDDDQRAAASAVDGPLLIVAGPGSGKTRTLTHRIAYLVAERGAAPEACLAITFTRRAAEEMRERLAALLPDAADRIPIHTFHSLGLAILREQPGAAGLHRGFRIASEAERTTMLAAALGLSEAKAQATLRAISRAKRTQEASAEAAAYQHAMALNDWIDFDDCVGLTLRVLADPALQASYRARFRWIAVDEFQDVDAQQYKLLSLLAPTDGSLCVIGDPDQAIYGFRGADAACFARFGADYPRARTVRLARNYRSSGTIVGAAAQVIAAASAAPSDAATHSEATAIRAMHERLTIHAAPSERAEAEFVVHTIEQLVGGHSFFSIDSGRSDGAADNLSFADFAVLYRTDAQAGALGEAFARSGMPMKRHSHAPLGERPEIAALLAALDPGGDVAAQLRAAARQDEALAPLLPQLLLLAVESGAAPRFAEALAQTTEADLWDPRADRVSLLTLHAAKGLEFPVVFIVGLEDGVLPLRFGGRDADDDEERRLFYVGMTRAKDRLFLTRAARRLWRGQVRPLPPSPFLDDIEEELAKHQTAPTLRRKADNQLTLF